MAQGQSGINAAFDKPFLSEEQQAFGKQVFETAAAPLQEAFGEQQKVGEELLAQRGIQFGGLGADSRQRLASSQQKALTGLAGQISTSLGQTALDQAFASSEAAKARQFQQDSGTQQQLLGLGLRGGLAGQALQDVFGKAGIDPGSVMIEGKTLAEFQEAQSKLTDQELEGALRSREDVLREELTFSLIQAGVHPNDVSKRLELILQSMGSGGGSERVLSQDEERDQRDLFSFREEQRRRQNESGIVGGHGR